MKVADYIFKTLADYGISHVFMVTGGGAMHLNDAIRKEKRLTPVCNHHEQASAIAAEGYFRASGKTATINVTSGPGGTNALTGVVGAWLDSIPMIVISGQVKFETTIASCPETGLRQLGDQELNIIDIVKPVTKYSTIVQSSNQIVEELDKAFQLAHEGRPGPVWLDIPLDVQGAEITLENDTVRNPKKNIYPPTASEDIAHVIYLINKAERPVIIAGHGIRLSNGINAFSSLLDKCKIPVLLTFNGFDIISSDHEFFMGAIGSLGNRCGNFILQNADLILSIGSRNNIRQVSYDWKNFARAAKLIMVDIDKAELRKKTIKPYLAIQADAHEFLSKLKAALPAPYSASPNWLDWCRERCRRFPRLDPNFSSDTNGVDPYFFAEQLTKIVPEETTIVAGNGTACVSLYQAGYVKRNHRTFWNSGCASMGYGLPAALGACFSNRNRLCICLTGDGSIQMNIQELQTVIHHKLNLKIIVLDNSGYSSIKQTQNNFFEGTIGCDIASGVSFPDIIKLAKAYGFKTFSIHNHDEIVTVINQMISTNTPSLCKVYLNPDMKFIPKLSSQKLPDGRIISKPLEDMFPFLERDIFIDNMLALKDRE